MSNRYDFTGKWNEPFSATIAVADSDGLPFNLTGYLFTGGVRYRYGDQDLKAFDITLLSPSASGLLQIDLSKTQMSGLPISECVHYVKAIPSGGNFIIDLAEGYFEVYPL